MFEKRIKKEELEELKKRTDLIVQQKAIISALELQNRIYLSKILPKYGYEAGEDFEIDIKNGKIKKTKVKPQPQK